MRKYRIGIEIGAEWTEQVAPIRVSQLVETENLEGAIKKALAARDLLKKYYETAIVKVIHEVETGRKLLGQDLNDAIARIGHD